MSVGDEKKISRKMLVFFDPQSGAFSWRIFYSPGSAGDVISWYRTQGSAFLMNGEFIDFTTGAYPLRLGLHASRGHASDIEDAARQSLRAVVEKDIPVMLDGGPNTTEVFLKDIDSTFLSPPESATPGGPPTIRDVKWRDGHWVITLQARWIEEITLDAAFHLVGTRKI